MLSLGQKGHRFESLTRTKARTLQDFYTDHRCQNEPDAYQQIPPNPHNLSLPAMSWLYLCRKVSQTTAIKNWSIRSVPALKFYSSRDSLVVKCLAWVKGPQVQVHNLDIGPFLVRILCWLQVPKLT